MTPQQPFLDEQGRPWRLDRRLAEGGEGAVYTVADDPALLAKLYTRTPSAQTVEKLTWMVQNSSSTLRQVAAWPVGLLYPQPGAPAAGFLMPRFVDFQPVHHLYNAAQRLKYFPRADWSFLAHAARNTAAAFEEVHAAGCLVGDVNQSNVLVAPRALIGLIDCDSFQVQAGERLFLCEVGVAHYTPPELQGQSFRGLARTVNHDRFGLAVLLFQLLFMGRNPYAGRFLGAGESNFERDIREFRFAYSAGAAALQMERPPHTPALDVVGPELGQLFERAFLRGSEVDTARPSATEWVQALERFGQALRVCAVDSGHKTLNPSACVWCALVQGGSPDFFRGVAAIALVFVLDRDRLAAVWVRIEAAARVGDDYDRTRFLPQPRPAPLPLPEGMAARPPEPALPALPRPVLVEPPAPRPRPLRHWLPDDLPDPRPQPRPTVAAPPEGLVNSRILSGFLAVVSIIGVVMLLLSLFGYPPLWLAATVSVIAVPAWVLHRRSYLPAWRLDEHRRQVQWQARMDLWQEAEQQRQARIEELRQVRREAERQRQEEYRPRRQAWEQAVGQARQDYQAQLSAWEAAEALRQQQLDAYQQLLKELRQAQREERKIRQQALDAAEEALSEVEQEWQTCANKFSSRLRKRMKRLGQAHQECQGLEEEYQRERQEMERNRETLAREQYLRTTFLSDHDIPNIKAGRMQILASYGIETAYDVEEERIRGISGFGPALTRNLMEWKQRVLAGFRFDSRTGVPEADLRALSQRYKQRQDALLDELEAGADELEAQAERTLAQLQTIEERLRPLATTWAQAQADVEVLA